MTARRSHATAAGGILVLNAGSSSIKFALHAASPDETPRLTSHGEIEALGTEPHLVARDAAGKVLVEQRWAADATVHELIESLIGWIVAQYGAAHLRAAGHRIALGGLEHSAPLLLTSATVERLRALVPLAPLHQPHNLEPVTILHHLRPDLPQVGCFDTAFHRTMPRVAELYGLPRKLSDAGARRYGFHGLSYEYVAGELPRFDPAAAAGRTIVAHLGSGASLCALRNGRSVATTMGFSPLSGLVMGTRPGEIDPGLLFWLMREARMSATDIESMLYRGSGLLGVSGISGDMRVLLASDDPHAREAIDLFVYRICREIGSLAAALNGLDALVFTGGIGEHAAPVRAAVCRQCAWLGIALELGENQQDGPLISTTDSKVRAWVVATDEELMIARHTAAIVFAGDPAMTA